ncbi:hypothetical protein D3C81_2093330 [compost metagenome]
MILLPSISSGYVLASSWERMPVPDTAVRITLPTIEHCPSFARPVTESIKIPIFVDPWN